MRTVLLATFLVASSLACSNVLVTPGASQDGNALVGDNDDSSKRHGLVSHYPAATHAPGDTREIWDFETGQLNGVIPQPNATYNVMAHGNEHGVVIAETTHGGISKLAGGQDTVLDYGSLIMVTLQRSRTAREAVQTIAALCNEYGYHSSMEGFSISDGDECWYMELIGKGDYAKGLLWVALRVPDGYFTANANQARIQTFLPCDDPSTCMMAPDVVEFAIAHGLWNGSATDPTFSFSDTYDPVTPTGARFCEARVWYIFRELALPEDFDAEYYRPYAQGFNLTRRMPLWVRPKAKLGRADVHRLLSSKYEGSWFDPSLDVGAGPEASPYRWNGLSYTSGGKAYVNERVVGTQFTAWHFVASVRNSSTPAPMRAVLWWGTDDHAWSPKVPLYGGATAVHPTYDDANCSARLACRQAAGLPGSMLQFSWESAYWVASAVARLVYLDYSRASAVVACERTAFEEWVAPMLAQAENTARAKWAAGDATGAQEALTALGVAAGGEATSRWKKLWESLMVQFQDGSTATADPSNGLCGCKKASPTYSDAWLAKVITDTGDHYRLASPDCAWVDADGHCHPEPKPPSSPAQPDAAGTHSKAHTPTPFLDSWFAHGFRPGAVSITHGGSAGTVAHDLTDSNLPHGEAAMAATRGEWAAVPKTQVRGVMG